MSTDIIFRQEYSFFLFFFFYSFFKKLFHKVGLSLRGAEGMRLRGTLRPLNILNFAENLFILDYISLVPTIHVYILIQNNHSLPIKVRSQFHQ